jgi:predicted nuclease with TOPRIM domain
MKVKKVIEDLSEKTFERDLTELRERVVRLEVQLAEMNKRLESLSNYTRQLYEYLTRLSR